MITVPIRDDFAMVVDFTHGLIYQVALTDNRVVAVDIPFPNYPRHAIYDQQHRYVYWTDFNANQIIRSTIEGTKQKRSY